MSNFTFQKIKRIKLPSFIYSLDILKDGRLAVLVWDRIFIFNTNTYLCELAFNCYEKHDSIPKLKHLTNGKLVCFSSNHLVFWNILPKKSFLEHLIKKTYVIGVEELQYNLIAVSDEKGIFLLQSVYPFEKICYIISNTEDRLNFLYKPKNFDLLLYGSDYGYLSIHDLKTYKDICTFKNLIINREEKAIEISENKVGVLGPYLQLYIVNLQTCTLDIIIKYSYTEYGSLVFGIPINENYMMGLSHKRCLMIMDKSLKNIKTLFLREYSRMRFLKKINNNNFVLALNNIFLIFKLIRN